MESLYLELIDQLKSGKRVHLVLEKHIILELTQDLENNKRPKQSLCLLSHSKNSHPEVFQLILQRLLDQDNDVDTIINCLAAIQKQIINYYLREGETLPAELLEGLEHLLEHKDAEVIEWSLRTIDQCGMQAKKLYPKIKSIEPGFSRFFNEHKMYMKGVINILEAKWGIK